MTHAECLRAAEFPQPNFNDFISDRWRDIAHYQSLKLVRANAVTFRFGSIKDEPGGYPCPTCFADQRVRPERNDLKLWVASLGGLGVLLALLGSIVLLRERTSLQPRAVS